MWEMEKEFLPAGYKKTEFTVILYLFFLFYLLTNKTITFFLLNVLKWFDFLVDHFKF